jgi:hypothetical protein
MKLVVMGKALIPMSRIREFTGERQKMSDFAKSNQSSAPEIPLERIALKIARLDSEIASLRKLILSGGSGAAASRSYRAQLREEETEKMVCVERIFFDQYSGPPTTPGEIRSERRTRDLFLARSVLFSSIKAVAPEITWTAIGLHYARHGTSVSHLVGKQASLPPTQKKDIRRIVELGIAALREKENRHG